MHGEALHRTLLSIHLIGVFLLLMGIGLLMVTMLGLRRARTAEELRQALFAGRWVEKIMPVGTVFVLIGGVWLAFLKDPDYNWHSAWIITAVVLVIALSINGAAHIGRKMERLGRESAARSGPLTPRLAAMSQDSLLHLTSWLGIGIIFSFVLLMVEKPGWLGSILWVLGGAAAGLAADWLAGRQAPAPQPKPLRKAG